MIVFLHFVGQKLLMGVGMGFGMGLEMKSCIGFSIRRIQTFTNKDDKQDNPETMIFALQMQ